MINGPKWQFSTILPLFWAAMGSNIFLFHLFHASWSEITHRKNHRKYYFHENQYFWHFWSKTLIRRAWYRTLLSKMALAGSNMGVHQKYRKLFLTKITHRKMVRKRFFHENWYFWHFWGKNWKNGLCTKVLFFNFAHFFDRIKKYRKYKKIVSPND